MGLPKKKRWPKGLKAALRRQEAKQRRIAENKKIEAAIQAAKRKLGRS